MALIEVELTKDGFAGMVQLLASAGPIPVGTLNSLGPARLISGISWGSVEVGPAPSGFNATPGTLTARAPVTLTHVSTSELDSNPNAAGANSNAIGWLFISVNQTELRIDVIGIDVAGGQPQLFSIPIILGRRRLDQLTGGGAISGAAILALDNFVTLRFSTTTSDILLATPLNVLASSPDDNWAIRISGEVFRDQLLTSLQDGVDPPPGGTTVEDDPTASWETFANTWFAVGHVGLEKEDACPGLLGDVDMSVTATVVMVITPITTVTPPLLNLEVNVSSDVSDWDSFRCWLGNGGIASIILGAFTAPIIGIAAGIGTMIGVGEIVRLDAGKEVAGGKLGGNLTKISSDDTSAKYVGTQPLPTLAMAGAGTTSGATVGPLGLVVTGTIHFLPAQHEVGFFPNNGQLVAQLAHHFSCQRRRWLNSADVQSIHISDRASILGLVDLGLVPITIFNSSVVVPDNLWNLQQTTPATDQSVSVVGTNAVKAGDGGRIYLHTSAGIRRYDIANLVGIPEPTDNETLIELSSCLAKTKLFTRLEKVRWLVDPPFYHYGYPPLRQWLFGFAEITTGTKLSFSRIKDGKLVREPISLFADKSKEAAIEFFTDAETDIVVEHDSETNVMGRVLQRWLLPTQLLSIGGTPTNLARVGSKIGVVWQKGLVTLNLDSGIVSRHSGDMELVKSPDKMLMAVHKQTFAIGNNAASTSKRLSAPRSATITGRSPPVSQPFSLTLSNGKIAAVVDDSLVIGIPWGYQN